MIKNIQDYQKKINLLKKYDKFYYDLSKPKVSDSEYDELKNDLLNFEKKKQ